MQPAGGGVPDAFPQHRLSPAEVRSRAGARPCPRERRSLAVETSSDPLKEWTPFMDGDRKYKQPGYMDSESSSPSPFSRDDRQRKSGPRPAARCNGPAAAADGGDGPRPRAVTTVRRRCPRAWDFSGTCPKCQVALHVCKQCSYFEPSTRFQCSKPVPVRIAYKDQANDCALFRARVTVARDSAPAASVVRGTAERPEALAPKTASDARIAFDNLFKK